MLSRGLTWGNKNIQRGVRVNRERLKIGKDSKKEKLKQRGMQEQPSKETGVHNILFQAGYFY